MLIDSLNSKRNQLISEGRYTDAADEMLIKAANAKVNSRLQKGKYEYGKVQI